MNLKDTSILKSYGDRHFNSYLDTSIEQNLDAIYEYKVSELKKGTIKIVFSQFKTVKKCGIQE